MKSNKQRYKESLNRKSPNNRGGGNTGMVILLTAIIMMVIIALKIFGNGIAGKDDLNIGVGKAAPDASKLEQLFR